MWQTVTKTMKSYARKPAAPKDKPAAPKTKPVKAPSAKGRPAATSHIQVPAPPAAAARGFDKSTSTKFKRGRLPIEGTLDLHGMTQERALSALQGFIKRSWRDGKRTLLIITGKGDRGKSTGVLRRMLPMWLEDGDLGNAVLAISPAQPRDGGDGAFYIRLRKST